MKIIHLVRATTWGGGERYALDLCRSLAERGHDVTVATRGHPLVDAPFADIPVRLTAMPLGGLLDFTTPRLLTRLVAEAPESRVVVHAHTFKDAELAVRAKRHLPPGKELWLVVTRHLVKAGKKSLRWRRIYRGIDRLIFVSRLAMEEFLSTRPPVDSTRLDVVYNSILPPPPPPPLPDRKNLQLLFTGRIAPEKGVDVLIRSMALLSDLPLSLRIVGTGDPAYLARLRDETRRAGVEGRIEWGGFTDDVYSEIGRADICVFPSRWREPFGLTVIEAMSQRRPVITTDHGAQREIITDGIDGLLVPPDNPEALAAAIRRLASDPALRGDISRGALSTFPARFSYPDFLTRILTLYQAPSS